MRCITECDHSLLLLAACSSSRPLPCGRRQAAADRRRCQDPQAGRLPDAPQSGPGKRPKKIEGYPFWSDHFVFPGKITLNLPTGFYTFELERGPEYYNVTGNFSIERFADDSKEVELRRVVDMSDEGWWSGDLHLRRYVRDLELIMSADDLHVAQADTWWNDKNDLSGKNLILPKNRLVTFDHDRVYELYCGGFTRGGTEVLCFHLPGPMPLQAQTDEYPSLAQHLQQARQKENSELWVDATASYGWDLPMLVANGLVDSIEVANSHFGRKAMQPDAKLGKPRDTIATPAPSATPAGRRTFTSSCWTAACGFRPRPAAGPAFRPIRPATTASTYTWTAASIISSGGRT